MVPSPLDGKIKKYTQMMNPRSQQAKKMTGLTYFRTLVTLQKYLLLKQMLECKSQTSVNMMENQLNQLLENQKTVKDIAEILLSRQQKNKQDLEQILNEFLEEYWRPMQILDSKVQMVNTQQNLEIWNTRLLNVLAQYTRKFDQGTKQQTISTTRRYSSLRPIADLVQHMNLLPSQSFTTMMEWMEKRSDEDLNRLIGKLLMLQKIYANPDSTEGDINSMIQDNILDKTLSDEIKNNPQFKQLLRKITQQKKQKQKQNLGVVQEAETTNKSWCVLL
jgi:hypothetical protein